jgi:hypothetical protein
MPITNATAPAARTTPNKPSAAQAKKTAADSEMTTARIEAVTSLGQFAQLPLMITKQYADAGALQVHWPAISTEIGKLASADERVAKIIDPLMQVGPYAGIIAAIMPFIVQIGVNHKRIPAGSMGSVPATTLSSQIESGLAKNELQALTIQRDAEAESAKVRKEIELARKGLADAMRDNQVAATND